MSTEQLLRERDTFPAGDPARLALRGRAIEQNLPLAGRLARRYIGRGIPLEDLSQVAAMGLVIAVDRFESARECRFVTYATPTILGSIKRHFRDTAWAVRMPRLTQELVRQVTDATGDLSQRQGRAPTPLEIAEHLHVAVADVHIAIGAYRAYHTVSLNAPVVGGDGTGLSDVLGADDPTYAMVDDRLAIQQYLRALPARERHIMQLRFTAHMSQSGIAAEVGVCQMQVSRLIRQSLEQLRQGMDADRCHDAR
jgi:RNA polymerase sigma-B factor